MDIFKFINSRDIRKHLINLNYEFTPVEVAWLVWQCYDATLEEKHKAWTEIIETMPDCDIDKFDEATGNKSLHLFLKEHMEEENRLIEMFFENEPDIQYSSTIYTWDNRYYSYRYCYNSFESCFYTSISEGNSDKRFIEITKEKLTTPYSRITISMDMHQKIYRVIYRDKITDRCEEPTISAFYDMQFNFPVPFKTGDIVYKRKRCGLYRGIMVYDELNNLDTKKHVCYKLDEYKRIERVNVYDFIMNLEYYHEELSSDENILSVLSNYLNGIISLDCLLNSYLLDIAEKQTTKLKNSYNYIKFLAQITTADDDDDLPY